MVKPQCQEQAWEIPPVTRSYGRDLTSKADQDSRDPLDLLEHLPQNQNLSYYFVPFTNSSDINRGLPFSGKSQLRALVNKSPGHDRSVSIQTPLMAF